MSEKWFRQTEKLLYDLPAIKESIQVMSAELQYLTTSSLVANYSGEWGGVGEVGRPTERLRDRREAIEAKIRYQEAKVAAVHGALTQLEGTDARISDLVRLRYWEHAKHDVVAMRLGMPRMSYFRLRASVVETVASWVGFR